MYKVIKRGERRGSIAVPASKSQAHRFLICAALGDKKTCIKCDNAPDDVLLTAECLNAVIADIKYENGIFTVMPDTDKSDNETLFCKESASTLRFLLPVMAALGKTVKFILGDSLSKRPIEPLIKVLSEHGAVIKKEKNAVLLSGKLTAGKYVIQGGVSSQFVSGLLFCLPLLNEQSLLSVTGNPESAPYIDMTEDAISRFGINFKKENGKYIIEKGQKYHYEGDLSVESDCSAAAFFLCMGALSEKGITVMNFPVSTLQGDYAIKEILKLFGADITQNKTELTVCRGELHGITLDASDIPDLIPPVAALAALANGVTVIKNAKRLIIKESNRIKSICDMINSSGGDAHETDDGIIINGKCFLEGGTVNSYKDHRIAMASAIIACKSRKGITVSDAECVEKSYKKFWEDFYSLEVQSN